MQDAVSIEERNKPTVTIVNEGFIHDARSAASSKKMPGIRVVLETIPSWCTIMEQIEAGVTATLVDDIVVALTKPLSLEEKSPKPKEVEKPSRVVFKGNLQEVNRFFYKRGWTDGLPIIPPTEEAVAEMLTGTDLPPDHLVALMGRREGKATVEKIAINAVMAGALPTYMPLLIAGVHSLLGFPEYGYLRFGVSAASWAPFWIINGPIRHDIHVNSGSGALSPGDIANAAIGRTMGLIIKNLGGVRKGVEDMGAIGNPGKYSLVIAENEEDSPWEPLHVEYGFNRDDSTISLSFPNSYMGGGARGTDAEGVLRGMAENFRRPQGCIILPPGHAKTLANKGWTKKQVKAYVVEYSGGLPDTIGGGTRTIPSELQGKAAPIRVLNPEDIAIVVAGGPGGLIGKLMGGTVVVGGEFSCWGRTTKKAELPKNWDKLVAKHKDMVPTYVRY